MQFDSERLCIRICMVKEIVKPKYTLPIGLEGLADIVSIGRQKAYYLRFQGRRVYLPYNSFTIIKTDPL